VAIRSLEMRLLRILITSIKKGNAISIHSILSLPPPDLLSPHPGGTKSYQCPICAAPFAGSAAAEEMLRHMQAHEQGELLKAGVGPLHPPLIPSPMHLQDRGSASLASVGSDSDARTPVGPLPSPVPLLGSHNPALANRGFNCPLCNKQGFPR
jgi:hypothetical protein